ncbi:hypothetical protein DL95DRAFT_488692 [Leptodontidium sp. 2 PMI_412]|nr:hypothetical protein DL95DRAFT_488692 [Leptodontidium sp. 2 PMI_412]
MYVCMYVCRACNAGSQVARQPGKAVRGSQHAARSTQVPSGSWAVGTINWAWTCSCPIHPWLRGPAQHSTSITLHHITSHPDQTSRQAQLGSAQSKPASVQFVRKEPLPSHSVSQSVASLTLAPLLSCPYKQIMGQNLFNRLGRCTQKTTTASRNGLALLKSPSSPRPHY